MRRTAEPATGSLPSAVDESTPRRSLPESTDVAIVGGGVSGLAVANAIADLDTDRRILVLDRRGVETDHRTWCFWEDGSNPVPEAVSASWSRWEIRTDTGVVVASDPEHPYRMVHAGHYRAAMHARLASHPSVRVISDTDVHTVDETHVSTNRGDSAAAAILDARSDAPGTATRRGRVRLHQRFLGEWICTTRPVFDPDTVTLMDFTGHDQASDVRFMYVLPVSATEALIEATVFATDRTTPHTFRGDIAAYVRRRWNLEFGEWEIVGREAGCIPMTDDRPHPTRIPAVGTRGGISRPSTGYAYARIQRHARDTAAAIVACHRPAEFRDRWRTRLLDAVFLRFLRDQPSLAPAVFMRMFRLPGPVTIRFLTERSTIGDELRLIAALPKRPFLRAAFSTIADRFRAGMS